MRRVTVLFTAPILCLLLAAPQAPARESPSVSARPEATKTDFNGDGFADLAIGVLSEGYAYGGAVSILYGSSGGLQADAPDDQFWNQDSIGVKDQAESADLFGSALATGDFNADGFSDLAIGVEGEDLGQDEGLKEEAGAVGVLYGTRLGLQASAPDDQFWTQDSPGLKDEAEEFDRWGIALATGDFNGDGYVDLAAGGSGEDLREGEEGAVSVLYGSPGGLQTTAPDDQLWSQHSPGVEDESELFDAFGQSLAASDFNADGFDDLAIGVFGESIDEFDRAGAINLLCGSAAGLQADSPDDQFWTQDSPGVQDRSERDDSFGSALSAGDFNGDGFADLAAGDSFEDLDSGFEQGAVNVMYGSAFGLQADLPDDQFWTQDSPGVRANAEEFDFFGWSVSAGDFNADGFDDLAIGVFGESAGALQDAGAVNVVYGSSGGLTADAPDDQFWSQAVTGVRGQAQEEESFGSAAASADFNADGFTDLAVGVPGDIVRDVVGAGSANVLYGTAGGLQADDPDDQLWNQGSPSVKETLEGDFFGAALVAAGFG